MKIVELVNKVRIPITNEESDFLGKFYNNKNVDKKTLSEREKKIATDLTNKDILTRYKKDDKIYYRKKIGSQ